MSLAPAQALVAVARAADLAPLSARTVDVEGRAITLFRAGAGVYAATAECPHRGGPLAEGLLGEGCVTCPLHGWRFDLRTGAVTANGDESARLAVFAVTEREGWLLVDAAEVAAVETGA